MPKQSAGILAYRFNSAKEIEVLLVHPGGPFYSKKDDGFWSIPKGEFEENEDALVVAKREFNEETGNELNTQTFLKLDLVKIKSGKTLHIWAVEADFKQPFISSNTFELEWPPKSGKTQQFLEIDKAEYFTLKEAKNKIFPGQLPLIDNLIDTLKLH